MQVKKNIKLSQSNEKLSKYYYVDKMKNEMGVTCRRHNE